jgi:ABC-2 type transport system ATP-binding protein
MSDPIIQVEQLKKVYGDFVAVRDVSFSVDQGEIFGILGPNGAGKTTTVETVMGLREPTSGSIRVLGLDPQRQTEALRQRTGIQLQKASLPDRLRVWEALDLFASFYQHPADWRTLLDQWGLTEKRSTPFGSLSGGQQQRLFIALALINDPEVVVLDELTSGLDPQARRTTWELIRQIRERGTTVVLVTHFMDEAEALCDRVALVDNKTIVAMDTPQKLIANLKAETRVKFTIHNGFDPSVLEAVTGVSRVEHTGLEVTVYGHGPLLSHVAKTLADSNLMPDDLRTERSTLEDVFIALTGREIRS